MADMSRRVGKFFAAKDVADGKTVRAVIDKVLLDVDMRGGARDVLTFRGEPKQLVLRPTITKYLMKEFGPDSDQWIGREIELYGSECTFGGDTVECCRVRTVKLN